MAGSKTAPPGKVSPAGFGCNPANNTVNAASAGDLCALCTPAPDAALHLEMLQQIVFTEFYGQLGGFTSAAQNRAL